MEPDIIAVIGVGSVKLCILRDKSGPLVLRVESAWTHDRAKNALRAIVQHRRKTYGGTVIFWPALLQPLKRLHVAQIQPAAL